MHFHCSINMKKSTETGSIFYVLRVFNLIFGCSNVKQTFQGLSANEKCLDELQNLTNDMLIQKKWINHLECFDSNFQSNSFHLQDFDEGNLTDLRKLNLF